MPGMHVNIVEKLRWGDIPTPKKCEGLSGHIVKILKMKKKHLLALQLDSCHLDVNMEKTLKHHNSHGGNADASHLAAIYGDFCYVSPANVMPTEELMPTKYQLWVKEEVEAKIVADAEDAARDDAAGGDAAGDDAARDDAAGDDAAQSTDKENVDTTQVDPQADAQIESKDLVFRMPKRWRKICSMPVPVYPHAPVERQSVLMDQVDLDAVMTGDVDFSMYGVE